MLQNYFFYCIISNEIISKNLKWTIIGGEIDENKKRDNRVNWNICAKIDWRKWKDNKIFVFWSKSKNGYSWSTRWAIYRFVSK